MQGICCTTGYHVCNGTCMDTTQDNNNCGSCGHQCGNGNPCVNGACDGYTFGNSPQAFVNACTVPGNTSVLQNVDDVATTLINIGFNFTFYNKPQTQFWANSNGIMGVGGTPSTRTYEVCPLPDFSNDRPGIYPFADDLITTNNGVCYVVRGTQPDRQLVITWDDVQLLLDTTAHLTFSVFLNETTNTVDFVYQTMTGATPEAQGSNATIGLEDDTGANTATFGTQYSCKTATITSTPLGVRFTPL
jgi:hypothetical protein